MKPLIKALLPILLTVAFLLSCHETQSEKTIPFSRWDDPIKDSFYFFEDNAMPVSTLLEEIYSTNTLLLWEDSAIIAEDVSLLKIMLPLLYNNGVREISCWFISPRIQTTLDLFLTSKDIETDSRQLLFLSEPLWGYMEYTDLIDSVRRFNLRLSEEQEPLLITAYSSKKPEKKNRKFTVLREEELTADFSKREVPLLKLYKPSFNEKREVILPYGESMELLIHHRGRDKNFFSFKRAGFPLEESEPLHPDDALLVVDFALKMSILTPIDNFITKENRDYALKILSERYKKTAASLNRKTADRLKKELKNLKEARQTYCYE